MLVGETFTDHSKTYHYVAVVLLPMVAIVPSLGIAAVQIKFKLKTMMMLSLTLFFLQISIKNQIEHRTSLAFISHITL